MEFLINNYLLSDSGGWKDISFLFLLYFDVRFGSCVLVVVLRSGSVVPCMDGTVRGWLVWSLFVPGLP